MFHRRLALLLLASLGVLGVLGLRLAHLTVVSHDTLRERAESRLVRSTWLPTRRGAILDRKGRVLASDRPAYELQVEYRVLDGSWARREARTLARRAIAEAGLGREALTDPLSTAFESALRSHLDTAWSRIAQIVGVEERELRDRAGDVVARVERMHDSIAERRERREIDRLRRSERPLTTGHLESLRRQAGAPIAEQRRPHAVLEDITDRAAFELLRAAERSITIVAELEYFGSFEATVDLLPGVEVRDVSRRERPFERVVVEIDTSTFPGPLRTAEPIELVVERSLDHLLGDIRGRVYAEDAQRRAEAIGSDQEFAARALTADGTDLGQYRAGDRAGATGVESAREHDLRGLRGLRRTRVDTGDRTETGSRAGRDIRVTVDAALQARVAAILDPRLGLAVVQPWHENEFLPLGTKLAGAAVVLDVDSGDVLAMVSTPAPFAPSAAGDDSAAPDDPEQPFGPGIDPNINRAISVPYPPGSISKALVAAEAERRGVYNPRSGIRCTGHYHPDNASAFRCWIYKRFGVTHSDDGRPVLLPESLQVSCNIFYYTLGERLYQAAGRRGISDAYRRFGLGAGFGFGVGPEWPGSIAASISAGGERPINAGESRLLGIGQGPVDWTPMHAASAYAALARGGVQLPPRLYADTPPTDPELLGIEPATIGRIVEGLRKAVGEYGGTGYDMAVDGVREVTFNAEGVSVWGKTGTATAPPLLHDFDGDGPLERTVVREGDHSWYVVVVRGRRGGPSYAIAVIVEYAGSGGRVSGPICNQIVHALAHEGYLRGVPGGAGEVASSGTRP